MQLRRCSAIGKLCYDKKGATTVINKDRTKRLLGKKLRCYWCGFCNFWHITHKEKMESTFDEQDKQLIYTHANNS